jgi:hypothetical protein
LSRVVKGFYLGWPTETTEVGQKAQPFPIRLPARTYNTPRGCDAVIWTGGPFVPPRKHTGTKDFIFIFLFIFFHFHFV